MSDHEKTFRPINFVWGALLGVFSATGMFFAGYALVEKRPPIAADKITLDHFIAYISWPWFFGIIVVFGLWGYLFNNRIGRFISDVYHHWLR